MHSFPLLEDVGTLDTHDIRLIARSCIWSTKGRRWLILGEVNLEYNVEMFLTSHCLNVIDKVGNWDLDASDSYIEECPVQVFPSMNCLLQTFKQGFARRLSLNTCLLFTPSPTMLIIDKLDNGLTSVENGISGCL